MKHYSLKEIANAYGKPHTTTWRHVKELVRKKLFKKETLGKTYNERECTELARLLEFPIDNLTKVKQKDLIKWKK